MRNFNCNMELRQVQQLAMDAVFDDFNNGHKRVLVIAPPAVGKTAMFGGIARYYLEKRPDSIVLVLSHLGLLIKQSGDSFKKFWSLDTDILKAETLPSGQSNCILSTVQSSSILDKILEWKLRLPVNKNVGMVILDEVHINSGVDRVDTIIDKYFPDAYVVGFTGSPFKNNKSMAGLFDRVSYSVSINDAIQMRLLVPPRLHGVQVDKKDLVDVMAKVINIVKTSHSKDKCVVFMRNIKDSNKMAEMFIESGFNAVSITSEVTGDKRDEILTSVRDDKEGSPQIMVSVDVLSVGFDCPTLQAVIMPYGTGSVATYLQRIGRGLRTSPNKTHCDVYIGGADPVVEQGEWERVNKKVMLAGNREAEEQVERETKEAELANKITLAEIKFKKDLLSKGMNVLHGMIGDRNFPKDLLGHLVDDKPVNRYHPKAKATDKQKDLINKYNLNGNGMTMNEAATVINALAKKYNWMSNTSSIVPSGKFKGQDKSRVPFSYVTLISNRNSQYYNAELAKFFKGE